MLRTRDNLMQRLIRVKHAATVIALAVVLTPAFGPASMSAYPAPGKRVFVRDHYMHINCRGTGGPTVVMDSGLGGTSLDWARIQPKIAEYTRVCTYDRSGYGWSDSGFGPRTSATLVHELRLLLEAANVMGPYVLVGHSFGGFNVRLFANEYPEDTAGLVLVDAAHEQQFERLEHASSGPRLAPRGEFVLFTQPTVSSDLPRPLQRIALALMSTTAAMGAVRGELAGFRLSAKQVAAHAWLPEVPMVVVTRGEQAWPETPEGNLKESIWRDMQDELAHRNGRAIHLIAQYSGHYIPLEEPEVVFNAVCIAVETARAGDPSRGLLSVWLKQRCQL